jgi:hypothetical protein
MSEKTNPVNAPPSQDINLGTYIKPQARLPHDPNVTFEEYHWYALRTREEEKTYETPKTDWKGLLLHKKKDNHNDASELHADTERKLSYAAGRLEISDEEWTNASRAFRTASWGAGMYVRARC